MRKLVLILIIALVGGQVTSMAKSHQEAFKYGDVKTKVLSGPDSDGDVWFSVKVDVRNDSGVDSNVSIRVRGLDAEGFEVVDVSIDGMLKASQRRELTNSNYVNYKAYQTIVKWEVEE